jgi:two-component system response regulator MprA
LKTLLIVDDSPLIRRMVKDALEADFDAVVEAADGVEGVEALSQGAPSLVLLDIEMPRLNGFDACRQMRAQTAMTEVPIVMLTSRDGEADVKAAFAAGATDYLVKPFAPGLLRARLRTWLLRSRVAQT